MNPIKFDGCNCVFAKDQPEYLQLPAHRAGDGQGTIITEWAFTPEERKRIAAGENLRISTLTFDMPLQPFRPYLDSLVEVYEEEEKGRKRNYATDTRVGDNDGNDYDISKQE